MLGVVLATPAIALAAARQTPSITTVRVPQSSWMAITLAIGYDQSVVSDTVTLNVHWRRRNGRELSFAPAVVHVAPGSGDVIVQSAYHGILPPPSSIVVHIELAARDGRRLATRDCEVNLVTVNGKDAWAGDLIRRNANALSWRVRSCT